MLLEQALLTMQEPCSLIQTPPFCMRAFLFGALDVPVNLFQDHLNPLRTFNPTELHKHLTGSETGVCNSPLSLESGQVCLTETIQVLQGNIKDDLSQGDFYIS